MCMLCPTYNVDRELRQAEGRKLYEICSTRLCREIAGDLRQRIRLVVSKVCAGRYGAGRARAGSTRGAERLMG